MKKSLFFTFVLVAVLILSACGPSEAEEEDKIQGAMEEYSAALLEGNLDRWIAIWQEDGIRMPGNEPRTVGIEQIRASVAPGFELFTFDEFQINPDEIQVLGDKAYTHGLYNYAMTPKSGGETIEFSGKFLTVYQKQEDGSWKIAVDSFSGNALPAAPPAEAGKEPDGVWCYLPEFEGLEVISFDPYQGSPDKAFLKVPYQSTWTGLLNGTSVDYGLVIGHVVDPDPEAIPAPMVFFETASFKGVEIEGKVGDLEMNTYGDRHNPEGIWKGTWVITSGTDDLEGIQGMGTFWGPGWMPDSNTEECGDWGLIYYEGEVEIGS